MKSRMPTKIIAVIPAYNEQETIAEVIQGTKQYVDEVLVINDGSTDGTKDIALAHGAIVVDNIVNRGLGPTIRRGYTETLNRGADIVVQLDADGQYLPREIPLLVQPILDNRADLVLGSRLENLQYRMPRIKKLGNIMFSWLIRSLAGADVRDAQTGFRATRREALEMSMPENRYTYTQEVILRIAKNGWRIKSVPVTFKERTSGESRLISHPFHYAFSSLIIITRTMRDYHPFAFFGLPGTLLIIMGLILGMAIVYKFAIAGFIGHTPAVVLTALMIILGAQLIFTGLIADMLRRPRS